MTGSGRGVTDVVAFVLMFSIIVLSVGLVSTAGLDSLTDLRDHEQINSAERGMETVASALGDLHRQGDTFRRVRLAPNDGHVRVNETTLGVSVVDSGGGTVFSESYDVGAIEHRLRAESRSTTIAYESGAVFRSDGGTPRFQPAWRCAPDHGVAVVSVVNLTTDGSIDVGAGRSGALVPSVEEIPREGIVESAGQSVDLSAVRVATTVDYSNATGDRNLTVDVSGTSQPAQWSFYLDDRSGWEYDAANDRWVCTGPDDILVRVTTIELSR